MTTAYMLCIRTGYLVVCFRFADTGINPNNKALWFNGSTRRRKVALPGG